MNPDTLAAQLEAASAAYYAGGTPVMSDAAYDALEDKLRAAAPDHPVFSKIGAPANSGWIKVAHPIPLGSLAKAQDEAEFLTWAAKLPAGKELLVSEKLDGISLLLTYQDGKLERGETRGDGTVGEDITRNVRIMKGVLPTVPWSGTVYVRGEVVCKKSDFAAHFQGESNPRNTASGTAKRQSGWQKAQHLTFMAYNLTLVAAEAPSRHGELRALENAGFLVPPWSQQPAASQALAVHSNYLQGLRDSLDYDIDGLVIELDDTDARRAMGESDMRPKGAIALKFPHDAKATTLRNIVWQVGNSGRVTPVAEFDATDLAGAQVSRASLHNVAYLQSLASDAGQACLCAGDSILVSRRNDVIPYVESLLVPLSAANPNMFLPPTACPSCNHGLVMQGEYLVCTGEDCPAQVAGSILRWVQKVNILHLGETLVRALVDADKVQNIGDLYTLKEQDLADFEIDGRKVGGNAKRVIASLDASRVLPVDLFVGSLGIPLCGRKMVGLLVAAGYDDLHLLDEVSEAEMARVPGFGAGRAAAFREGFEARKYLMTGILASGVTTTKPATAQVTGSAMAGHAVCMTGFRDADMADAIVAAGGKMASGVSRNTTILVTKDPTSTSGKAQKARGLGIEILGVDEMWDRLGGRP